MLGACPAQVRMLEAASYAPVFAPVAPMGREDTRDVAARLAAAVRAGIKALEAVPAAASPVTVPGAVPAPAPPPNPAEKLKGILEMLQTAFGIVAAPDAGNLQAVEMAEMRALERAAPSEEEGALLSPAAKRFNLPHAPMVRANGTLTDRSRYMIRHGLQKASNLDVPIVEEKYQDPWLRMRRERLVGDSENAFLVALTGALGNALQALSVSVLAALAERYPDLKLPVVRRVPARPYVAFEMVPAGECARRVSFRWLRWFASYPNLVGILVVWLAAWFAWRLLLIAGKVLWYAFAAPRAVPTPRAVPQRGPQQGYQRQHQGPGGRGAYKAPMY
ncbi:hypothetical protein DFJ74DRAFT_678964 [Hyaloraphidium curvatum]|nr:hypothetical protein DFJ74DRAFT_678964 [Hyaloraphidium curvatum]